MQLTPALVDRLKPACSRCREAIGDPVEIKRKLTSIMDLGLLYACPGFIRTSRSQQPIDFSETQATFLDYSVACAQNADHEPGMSMAQQRLELVLDDVVDGTPVDPLSMPVGLLSQFHEQIARFLKGSHADVQLDSLRVSIEHGSYKLVLPAMALVSGLASDLALLGSGNIDGMDPKRAKVIEEWQEDARRVPTRRYGVLADSIEPVYIHADTRLKRNDAAVWVTVEKYVLGQVRDLGGKKPNLHLQLADGTTLKVDTSKDQVLNEDKNLVYRDTLLHVRAEEDIATGQLRNARLIAFVDHAPTFEPQSFEAMVAKGRKAWADVPDASHWVEEQRGHG